MRAKEVLDEAKFAWEMLEDETDEQRFHVIWVAAITLLREVGHVLDKVDTKENALLMAKQQTWWAKLKAEKGTHPHIFWDFIDGERNATIKEYSKGYTPNAMLGVADIREGTVEMLLTEECLFVPLVRGAYENEDCRDILLEAINWWGQQLSILENS